MLHLECIVRARLAGQAYDEYAERGTIHGEPAPSGMRLTDAFESRVHPLDEGGVRPRREHLPWTRRAGSSARRSSTRPRGSASTLFDVGAAAMAAAGLVLADTKFELGLVDGALVCATRS